MKKLILLFLIPFSLFAKNISYEEFNKNFTSEIASNLNLVKDFKKDTGETNENYQTYLHNAMLDDNWKQAMYYLYFYSKEVDVKYGSKKYDRKIVVPDLEKGLEYLEKSTKTTSNPLSAYAGVSLLTQYYMTVQGAEIPRKYMRTFSKVLKERNYCLGYMYYGRSFFKEFTLTPNYQMAYNILKEGDEKCIKEGVEPYIPQYLKHQRVKAKTLAKENK